MATWYTSPIERTKEWDIMISYQHKHKIKAKRIYNWLKTNGYSVWFDEIEVYCDIYDRMAEGINNSNVILVCISSYYESSVNCERKYKFAQDKKKKIIPLKMEKYYPIKALGLIIAGKFYHEFLDDLKQTDFDEKMKSLEKDIKANLKGEKLYLNK